MKLKTIFTTSLALFTLASQAQELTSMFSPIKWEQKAEYQTKTLNPQKIVNQSAKTTGPGGTRVMNSVVDIYVNGSGEIADNAYFLTMFPDSTARILYQDASGNFSLGAPVAFSINDIYAPFAPIANTPFYDGELDMSLNQNNNINLDTVAVSGYYFRNNSNVVDSLILNVTTGDYQDFYFLALGNDPNTPNEFPDDYGVDTLKFYMTGVDTATNEGQFTSGYRYAIALDDAAFIDTNAGGYHTFYFPVNVPMTNQDIVATSVSFKYGGAYTDNDTINTQLNSWRQLLYEEKDGELQQYVQDSTWAVTGLNNSQSKYDTSFVLNEIFLPSYIFGAGYPYEHADIDYFFSCPDCEILSIVDKNLSLGTAFPNPATDRLLVPMDLTNAADVTLKVTNVLGQEMLNKTIKGTSGKSHVELDVSSLEKGFYMISVSSNGANAGSLKFSVK